MLPSFFGFIGLCFALSASVVPAFALEAPVWPYPAVRTSGLTAEDGGQLVYDANQSVYWLANANLAADPRIRAELGVRGISPDGTMDYPTARRWVYALNHYRGGGYLGHEDWQLPDNPPSDNSCSSIGPKPYRNYFGAGCTASALGNLFSFGLTRNFAESVVPDFTNTVGPFHNLQPSLYWTVDTNPGGQATYSFVTNIEAGNTTKYNYFYVLPMVKGWIGQGAKPSGTGLIPYASGPAAGKAIYDASADITWITDGSLAAHENFGVVGKTSITRMNGKTITVPLINSSGAMLYDTAFAKWIYAMGQQGYAGSSKWSIPHVSDLLKLFQALGIQAGDTRFAAKGTTGPIQNLQPFFYWACERDQSGNSQSPCNGHEAGKTSGGAIMQWSFNLDTGFQGTSMESKPFHVMVYFPAPGTPQPQPPHCTTPETCCTIAGGIWARGHCRTPESD